MSELTGIPALVGKNGNGQLLEHVALSRLGEGSFDEAWLQRLIHDNPACLPIAEIEPGLGSFHAICREMQTPHGYIDNLLMTASGDIAIVETKLFRNPEARRKVLAQVLDYAIAIFGMTYDGFEKAALTGTFSNGKPKSLYEALPAADKLPLQRFHDSVARNLRRGSALLLIVGDGIRTEAETLLGGLDVYARFHFTVALVELAVFRMPGTTDLLVRPRTLAKTETVKRYVFEAVQAGQAAEIASSGLLQEQKETLSSDAFWNALESKVPGMRQPLETLIRDAEPLGVYPDFRASLNLKWQRPGAPTPVNLGYIMTHGSLWTDLASNRVPQELARQYVGEIASAFDCDVHQMPSGNGWTPYRSGHPVRIQEIRDRLTQWTPIMQRFITAISKHDEATA